VANSTLYFHGIDQSAAYSTWKYNPQTPHPLADLPTVSGTAMVGQTLTATPGPGWPDGTTFSYSWVAGGHQVTTDTSDTYVIQPGDAGTFVGVAVEGTEPGYTDNFSQPTETAIVLPAVIAPSKVLIRGAGEVGGTLTATAAGWPVSDNLTYRWLRSGVPILRADSMNYTPDAADGGAEISVVITEHAVGYTVASAASPPVRIARAFTVVRRPEISGDWLAGRALQVAPLPWSPGAVTLRLQWFRDSRAIPGAMSPRYVPTRADVGHTITVRLTGTEPGFTSQTVSSVPHVIR
jgi:hypothetical protein